MAGRYLAEESLRRLSKALREWEGRLKGGREGRPIADRMPNGATRFRLLGNLDKEAGAPGVRMALDFAADDSPIWYELESTEWLMPGASDMLDLGEGDEVFAIQMDGDIWAVIGGARSASVTGIGCGACSEDSGDQLVELPNGDFASGEYTFLGLCNGGLNFVLRSTSIGTVGTGTTPEDVGSGSGEVTGATWVSVSILKAICREVEVSFTATLQFTNNLPGGITLTITDGTGVWQWVNDTAWQPNQPQPMVFVNITGKCLCAPFRPFPCLVPKKLAA